MAGGAAGGQIIEISGSGKTLGLIGTGDYGNPSGTATVTYTDGTAESHTISFADWWANAATAATSSPPCRTSTTAGGQTVRYLTLPDISSGANKGEAVMHIFSIAIG